MSQFIELFEAATTRLGMVPAPGGLALAQGLVNTLPIGGYVPDLLDGEPRGAELRAVRERLIAVLRGETVAGDVASARLSLGADGRLAFETRDLADELWLCVALAQRDGSWARLKLCRNAECGSAFYDRSRNNSGVWHDVRSCGNTANLRAYRARRKATGGQGD